jgi:hypothetical protein
MGLHPSVDRLSDCLLHIECDLNVVSCHSFCLKRFIFLSPFFQQFRISHRFSTIKSLGDLHKHPCWHANMFSHQFAVKDLVGTHFLINFLFFSSSRFFFSSLTLPQFHFRHSFVFRFVPNIYDILPYERNKVETLSWSKW